MRIQLALWLIALSSLAACGPANTVMSDLATPVQDLALPEGDLASAPGTCSPACGGLTPHCNSGGHCVSCLVDGDCPLGSQCKVLGPSASSCLPGCVDASHCGPGKMCCASACVDTTMDVSNCGACGTVCMANHSSATCSASKCQSGACAEGYGDCNNNPNDGCETSLHTDPNNCAACGMMCSFPNAIAACADTCYLAACQFGFADCDMNAMNGCETSVLSDPANCGGCGTPCKALANASPLCMSGGCQIGSCNPGFFDCDRMAQNGCEVNIFTDNSNCGACGAACANGLVCKNGGCTCPNCNFANATSTCVNNQCVLASCNAGYGDCNKNPGDGCEVDELFDAKNCGACGATCANPTPYCVKGVCSNVNPQPCSVVATAFCTQMNWKVVAGGPGKGGVVCTVDGRSANNDCDTCATYNFVVWVANSPLPVGCNNMYSTKVGIVYSAHQPCMCGDNLQPCGNWDLMGCMPD